MTDPLALETAIAPENESSALAGRKPRVVDAPRLHAADPAPEMLPGHLPTWHATPEPTPEMGMAWRPTAGETLRRRVRVNLAVSTKGVWTMDTTAEIDSDGPADLAQELADLLRMTYDVALEEIARRTEGNAMGAGE